MLALISNISGNLEALDAVLARMDEIDIVCLGDVVCYGPNSIECVSKSLGWSSTIAGPLDAALLKHDHRQWDPTTNKHIEVVRSRFWEAPDFETLNRILESYGPEFTANGHRYFHGSPGNFRGWIFPEEIYCPANLDRIVDRPEHVFIGGGTCLPGIFRRSSRDWEFIVPENGKVYTLPQDEKTIITVGSVGQPRDGDPRAAYSIIDDTSIVFHRLTYDVETTRQKILDDPDIHDMHGDRLIVGR